MLRQPGGNRGCVLFDVADQTGFETWGNNEQTFSGTGYDKADSQEVLGSLVVIWLSLNVDVVFLWSSHDASSRLLFLEHIEGMIKV